MPKINQLDKSVYELIAAGEVIERPSSVIKELAENAIDAGAHIITVEIKRGGITYMRITDNGCGISYEDVPLAFQRHATSKVYTAQDLENINTLGFRGEALASVAAVSRIEAVTKRAEDELGTCYKIEGSAPTEYDRTGCADGTTIIIRDLFYNTPARLKFLKKDVTEGNYCANVIEKLALSHPDISFRFIRDGKQTLFTPGDAEYFNAIHAVFGKQFAAGMIPVDSIYRDIGVTGFVSSPLFTRSNRTMQNFFVNGRSVKNPICCAALEEAFRNSIMTGKFPACVLNVNIDPALLDANISPAKTEVRFSNDKAVFDAVYYAVKNSLLGYDESREIVLPKAAENSVQNVLEGGASDNAGSSYDSKTVNDTPKAPTVSIPTGGSVGVALQAQTQPKPERKPDAENFYRRPSVPYQFPAPDEKAEQTVLPDCEPQLVKSEKTHGKPIDETPIEELPGFSYLSKKSFEKKEEPANEPAEEAPKPVEKAPENIPDISVIGELFKTYILCESGESLILIDKHAAHERINFERFKKERNTNVQLLLEPKEVFLLPDEYEAVSNFKEHLESVGISLRFEDGGKVMVDGLPEPLAECDPEDLLQSISETLSKNNTNAEGLLFDDVLHTMACKASIRANEDQDISELAYLANIVLRDNNIRYCPHGRPVLTQISKRQIEKYFGRIV